MKVRGLIIVVAALLLAGTSSSWAGGRVHGSVGIYFGPGAFWGGPYYGRPHYYPSPFWYPAPYYEPAPVIVVPPAPTVYIEQGAAPAAAAPEAQNYWYFCRETNAYYPYVRECPRGWQRVLPQPAQ